MKTLIFSDVHEQVDLLDQLLTAVPHDRAIGHGDFFDDYCTSPAKVQRTAEWIRSHLNDFDSVLGNHDVPYFYGATTGHYNCPGYSRERGTLVRTILGPEHWQKFTLHAWVDGWLVAHAGVHPYLFRAAGIKLDPEGMKEVIDYACSDALRALRLGQRHFMVGWGSDRGGDDQVVGGINWLDWNSLQAIPGLNQLVGHTYDPDKIRSKVTPESQNFCLDTGFHHFAIIEDGRLEIYKTEDFIGKWRRRKAR